MVPIFLLKARVEKKILSHDVRPILGSVIALHSLILNKSHHEQHMRNVLALGAAILFVVLRYVIAQERLQSNQSGMGVGEELVMCRARVLA